MSFDQKSLELFRKRVFDYHRYYGGMNKKSHNKNWQPVRFAVRDQVIGLIDSKHETKENIILVDVFLTEDPDWIKDYSGTKFGILYLLSEAYQCGSTMGIKFTQDVEEGTIPTNLVEMASFFGIDLKFIIEGFITPKESRMLFLTLTGFSEAALKRIKEISIADAITPERICYLVNHGTWTLDEMEAIILGSQHPESILSGNIDIADYLAYSQVVSTARSVILCSFLDRKLRLKEIFKEDKFVDIEANDRKFQTSFDSNFFAKVYLTQEETPIPWTNLPSLSVPANERLVVAIRDYDWTDFFLNFDRDRKALKTMISQYQDQTPTHFFLLLPRNLLDLPDQIDLNDYLDKLKNDGINVMICPELLVMLDDDVIKRLQKMAFIRHDLIAREVIKKVFSKISSLYNSPKLKLVTVPKDTQEGLAILSKLIDQYLYDSVELASQVNRVNVENRFHRTMDRIIYLGKLSLIYQNTSTYSFSESFLDELVNL
jgi:hypothetical protein